MGDKALKDGKKVQTPGRVGDKSAATSKPVETDVKSSAALHELRSDTALPDQVDPTGDDRSFSSTVIILYAYILSRCKQLT